MAQFTFNGEVVMNYPNIGIVAVPNQTYELDADPADGCWTAVATKTSKTTPQADSAPADAPTDPTPSN
jgi:hypothetical protein